MDLQVISRDGEPEYAVLPWAQYQALLKAAGLSGKRDAQSASEPLGSAASELPGLTSCVPCVRPNGLEVASLARTVGISPSYLELIENGTREPDAAIKRSLAWELGVAGWRGES
ncbi:helix-turn-helix transcriptional regulator [Pseudomonas syringae pv. actinidiae]|nr:helix-turn-helix transcriptional regulator [Pseudomonas syringae pv. actinidiae]